MRTLLLFIIIFISTNLYSQSTIALGPFIEYQAMINNGTLSEDQELLDGYSKSSSSKSIGLNILFKNNFGANISYSHLNMKSDGFQISYNSIEAMYEQNPLILISQGGTVNTHGYKFNVINFGVYKNFQLQYLELSLGLNYGIMNEIINDDYSESTFSHHYSDTDGLQAEHLAFYEGGYFLNPQISVSKSIYKQLYFSLSLDLKIGEFDYIYTENVVDNSNTLSNFSNFDKMGFNTIGLNLGISYRFHL